MTWLPIVAIVIACISLSVSIYVVRRDRAKVRSWSQLMVFGETSVPIASVNILNEGRRPVILYRLHNEYRSGTSYESMGEHGKGIKLGEQERHDFQVGPSDFRLIHGEDAEELIELKLEDTTGKIYPIRHIRKHLEAVIRGSIAP